MVWLLDSTLAPTLLATCQTRYGARDIGICIHSREIFSSGYSAYRMKNHTLLLQALANIPRIEAGDDLTRLIIRVTVDSDNELRDGDILCLAQKIISKAEGRVVDLAEVSPSQHAKTLALEIGKDPRLVELILSESQEIIACKPGVIIVEHHCGVILANAGIDHSNVNDPGGKDVVLLLPKDPDASAKLIHDRLKTLTNKHIGVIITDSIGRPWRLGTVGLAIGSAGIQTLRDLRGHRDMFGHELRVSETADADSLASAACLLMGEADEATPIVLIRGYNARVMDQGARHLLRDKTQDLFR